MNKTNIILIVLIALIVGSLGGYVLASSDDHDEGYIKETAEMMKDDAEMMKEVAEMMNKSGMMMNELGVKYNDSELTAEGKAAVDEARKLQTGSEEMEKRGSKMMEMME